MKYYKDNVIFVNFEELQKQKKLQKLNIIKAWAVFILLTFFGLVIPYLFLITS
jgi:hypothetical protein